MAQRSLALRAHALPVAGLLATALVGIPSTVRAQTGVSDDRVSLPDGPGSLGGLGENASAEGNLGQMSYGVAVEVPAGYAGMTPSLRLGYNSGAGSSVAGIGWSLPMPAVERMTSRGLPRYDDTDLFTSDEGGELVLIPGTNPPVYRSRFERAFTRFTWMDRGTSNTGYWKAETSNGNVNYYGATRDGTIVPSARVAAGPNLNVFKYLLVETVDVYGHSIRYNYAMSGNWPLLSSVEYVHDSNGTPKYRVTFEYEPRFDFLSDCKPGFELVLRDRLRRINVLHQTELIRYYTLAYEAEAVSGGFTRLASVQSFAYDDTPHPAVFTFGYSRALGGVCTTADCGMPILVQPTGRVGASIANGRATLIDINGDSVPDVVETRDSGQPHQFYISTIGTDGSHAFSAAQVTGNVNANMLLDAPGVQVIDANGDGFTDMVNARTNALLLNMGLGDWAMSGTLSGTVEIPDFDADRMDGQTSIKFLDYDNDKRIDIIQSTGTGGSNTTSIFANTGDGFVQVNALDLDNIGWGFQENDLHLDDMNGDGLLDAVIVIAGQVSYRLNMGRGRWGVQRDITGLSIPNPTLAELEDINGDGLADLVVVSGNTVTYAINRNGASFLPTETISMASGQPLPARDPGVNVLYADMNANGSNDIVWIDALGNVTYLELFPLRPNLLSRITNGLGANIQVTYATGLSHMLRDGGSGAWTHKIPQSMLVVDHLDTWESFSNLHDDTAFRYHEAYYDGEEKQFRGFGLVEALSDADMTQEPGRTETEFDLGNTDRYRAGLQIRKLEESNQQPISEVVSTYADCPVAELGTGTLRYPVRHVCKTADVTTIMEGRPASEWITTESRMTYDGYGNVTHSEQLGVTSVGGGACGACDSDPANLGAPCGAMCLGDEKYEDTEYVPNTATGGRWMLGKVARQQKSGVAGPSARTTDVRNYYDGQPFVGLASGLTLGNVTRSTAAISATATVEVFRNRYDAHGNVIEVIDSNGTVGGMDNRLTREFDALGLRPIRSEHHLVDGTNAPYTLRRDYAYEDLFGRPIQATSWMVVQNGQAQTAANPSFWRWDSLGRLDAMVIPGGDTLASPSVTYSYEMADPVSRLVIQKRTRVGAAPDQEEIKCLDGKGRTIQTRRRIASNRYLVSDFVVRNAEGAEVRTYQNYESTSATCDMTPGTQSLFNEHTYDGTGRLKTVTYPDGTLYPTASQTRTEYFPLETRHWDAQDTDSADPLRDTPNVQRTNGLGNVISIERTLTRGGSPVVYQLFYDDLGYFRGYRDPQGNTKIQERDLQGRITRITDPDRGVMLQEHDPRGNVVRHTDARGVVTRVAFDGLDRIIGQWREDDETNTRISYTYDKSNGCASTDCTNLAGVLSEVTYPVEPGSFGRDRFGYNSQGRITYYARQLNGYDFVFGNEYDNQGNLLAFTLPKGRRIDHTLDGMGRATAVAGLVDAVSYDTRGQVAELQLANGVQMRNQLDALMRLDEVTATRNGTDILSYAYTRDRLGNVLSVTDRRAGRTAPSASASYTYDGFQRLLTAQMDTGNANAETLTYTYDTSANILSQVSSKTGSPVHVGTYTYGENAGPHAVTHAGNLVLGYDAAGNMVSRGGRTLEWDYMGRLTKVSQGSATLATFGYGPKTDRVVKREGGHTTWYVTPEYEVRDGASTAYVAIGERRFAKIEEANMGPDLLSDVGPVQLAGNAATPDPDATISAADAWISQASSASIFTLPSTASPVRELLAASARRTLLRGAPRTTYMHHDALGSVAAITDSNGAVVQQVEYFPYGGIRHAPDGDQESRTYSGMEMDEVSGLTYFGGRYYDSFTGRWASADPAFLEATTQNVTSVTEATGAYEFCEGNPIVKRDPDGRIVNFIVGGIAGLIVSSVMGIAQIIQQKPWRDENGKFTWKGVAIAALKFTGGVIAATVAAAATSGVSAVGTFISRGAEMVAYEAALMGHMDERDANGSRVNNYDQARHLAARDAGYVGMTLSVAEGGASLAVHGAAKLAEVGASVGARVAGSLRQWWTGRKIRAAQAARRAPAAPRPQPAAVVVARPEAGGSEAVARVANEGVRGAMVGRGDAAGIRNAPQVQSPNQRAMANR